MAENRVQDVMKYYRGKRVLVTGHTGFKGSWLCSMLLHSGARVSGYALEPQTEPALFHLARLSDRMDSTIGDIRDFSALKETFERVQPQVVFHLAAQPLVLESYRRPRETYEINVMGTVNVMECIRILGGVESAVNVTTDKVYRNNEWCWGYREDEFLDGFDPYSNSKSCSELVTHSYNRSFFQDQKSGRQEPAMSAISTARAGNVIGGGDFAADRIIPDCIRAAIADEVIQIRNPLSVRPYQHVLEPLYCYMMIAAMQAKDRKYSGSYNIGPDEGNCVTTGELADLFCRSWGDGVTWESKTPGSAFHEANYLKLDCSRLKSVFGWKSRWNISETVDMICEWCRVWLSGGSIQDEMNREIRLFLGEQERRT